MTPMNHRLSTALVAVGLLIAAAACGNDDDDSQSTTTVPTTAATTTAPESTTTEDDETSTTEADDDDDTSTTEDDGSGGGGGEQDPELAALLLTQDDLGPTFEALPPDDDSDDELCDGVDIDSDPEAKAEAEFTTDRTFVSSGAARFADGDDTTFFDDVRRAVSDCQAQGADVESAGVDAGDEALRITITADGFIAEAVYMQVGETFGFVAIAVGEGDTPEVDLEPLVATLESNLAG